MWTSKWASCGLPGRAELQPSPAPAGMEPPKKVLKQSTLLGIIRRVDALEQSVAVQPIRKTAELQAEQAARQALEAEQHGFAASAVVAGKKGRGKRYSQQAINPFEALPEILAAAEQVHTGRTVQMQRSLMTAAVMEAAR